MNENTSGHGGKRQGAGKPTLAPVGSGEPTRVSVRLGTDLLDALRQRYPTLTSDGELLRAAAWAAIGQPVEGL